jgi:hypothetical protein
MKKAILILFFILKFSDYLMADIIITSNGTHYGRITEIDSKSISMREGCGNAIYTTFWDTRTRIVFNSECMPPTVEASTSPVTADFSCDKANVFTVNFSAIQGTFYCSAITFNGTNFDFQLYDGRRFRFKDFSTMKDSGAIGFESICKTFMKQPTSIPSWLEAD